MLFFFWLLLLVARIVLGALFAELQKLSATGWKFFCFILVLFRGVPFVQ
jgi:hypothetical protein